MRAVHYEAFGGPVEVREVAQPTVRPDGALIRVEARSVRSDWHGWMGHDDDIRLPHVPGHEYAGTIAALGRDVAGPWRGDRVTVPFVCACGKCEPVAWGRPDVRAAGAAGLHELGRVRGARSRAARRGQPRGLPDDLDAVTAASLGCRFATAYRGVTMQGAARRPDMAGGLRLRGRRAVGGHDRAGARRPRHRGRCRARSARRGPGPGRELVLDPADGDPAAIGTHTGGGAP